MTTTRWEPDGLPAEILACIDMNPDNPNGCWVWTGTLNKAGYGTMRVQIPGKRASVPHIMAHRFVWETTKRQRIPGRIGGEPCELDHACHNRACVNPGHLTPVPKSVNLSNRRGA